MGNSSSSSNKRSDQSERSSLSDDAPGEKKNNNEKQCPALKILTELLPSLMNTSETRLEDLIAVSETFVTLLKQIQRLHRNANEDRELGLQHRVDSCYVGNGGFKDSLDGYSIQESEPSFDSEQDSTQAYISESDVTSKTDSEDEDDSEDGFGSVDYGSEDEDSSEEDDSEDEGSSEEDNSSEDEDDSEKSPVEDEIEKLRARFSEFCKTLQLDPTNINASYLLVPISSVTDVKIASSGSSTSGPEAQSYDVTRDDSDDEQQDASDSEDYDDDSEESSAEEDEVEKLGAHLYEFCKKIQLDPKTISTDDLMARILNAVDDAEKIDSQRSSTSSATYVQSDDEQRDASDSDNSDDSEKTTSDSE